MYGMFRADCTDSHTVFNTRSLLTSRCLVRRDGIAGVPKDCASKLVKALHGAHCSVSAQAVWSETTASCDVCGRAGEPRSHLGRIAELSIRHAQHWRLQWLLGALASLMWWLGAHLDAPNIGAEELLEAMSWTLKAEGITGRGVRVPPSLKPSVTVSVRSCRVTGALLEPMLAGVSPIPLPALDTGLPKVPMPGLSGPRPGNGSSSALGIFCNGEEDY